MYVNFIYKKKIKKKIKKNIYTKKKIQNIGKQQKKYIYKKHEKNIKYEK